MRNGFMIKLFLSAVNFSEFNHSKSRQPSNQAQGWEITCGFEPQQGQECALLSQGPDPFWAPYLLFDWVPVFLPQGSKRPGLEFGHSPSPSVEAKDVWSWTFSPVECLHGRLYHYIYLTIESPVVTVCGSRSNISESAKLRNNPARCIFFMLSQKIIPLKKIMWPFNWNNAFCELGSGSYVLFQQTPGFVYYAFYPFLK
jgi:hypothetical protein